MSDNNYDYGLPYDPNQLRILMDGSGNWIGGNQDLSGRNVWGTMGPLSGAISDLDRGGAPVNYNGQQYSRTGLDPSNLIRTAEQYGIKLSPEQLSALSSPAAYDSQYGYMMPTSTWNPIREEFRKEEARRNEADMSSLMAWGLVAGGALGGIASGALAAVPAAGEAVGAGAAGATAGAGAGGAGAGAGFDFAGTYGAVPSFGSGSGLGAGGFDFASTYAPTFGSGGMDLSSFFGAGANINPLDALNFSEPLANYGGALVNPEIAPTFTDSIQSLFGAGANNASASSSIADLVKKYGEQAVKSALGGAAGSGSGNSILGDLIGNKNLAGLLGGVGSSALGYLGAQDQIKSYERMQDKYLGLGQPYRDKLAASYQPGFDMSSDPAYTGALDQASNSVLRKLSATGGNPFDNPGGVMEANKYVTQNVALPQLNTYRSQLGSFGQLGTNQAGTAGLGAAQNAGGTYDALGAGLQALTKPQDPYADLFKNMKLNLGGSY